MSTVRLACKNELVEADGWIVPNCFSFGLTIIFCVLQPASAINVIYFFNVVFPAIAGFPKIDAYAILNS